MSTLGLHYHQVKWDFLDVLHHKTFSSGKSQLHFNAIFNLLNEVYIGFPATFWVPRKPPKAGVKNHPYKTYEPPHLALFEMKELQTPQLSVEGCPHRSDAGSDFQ